MGSSCKAGFSKPPLSRLLAYGKRLRFCTKLEYISIALTPQSLPSLPPQTIEPKHPACYRTRSHSRTLLLALAAALPIAAPLPA